MMHRSPRLDHDIERVLVDRVAIERRVAELGAQIASDYAGREGRLLLVPVMTGGLVFAADLMRQLPHRLRLGLVTVSSYPGTSTESRGAAIRGALPAGLEGAHALIIDDILDTGRTLMMLRKEILAKGAASVATCVLVRKEKPEAMATPCEYSGFDIPDEFVVGYGLDYDDEYRNLPYIGILRREVIR